MNGLTRGGPLGPMRFTVAVHALLLLARDEEVCSSATLARRVNAHATFLRRVAVHLVRAGIVEAKEGRGGGYLLARRPDQITLGEVYRAVKATELEDGEGVAEEPPAPAEAWMATLTGIIDETEESAIRILDQHTIAELLG